jgi:hypothetical protein
MTKWLLTPALIVLPGIGDFVHADPPAVSYIFPAGGQRGTTVNFRVGGLCLYSGCPFEMLGPGVESGKEIKRTKTIWFEGPLLQLPESQQAEDYPKDYAGQVRIAADAPPGVRYWRVWNAQGAPPAMKFMVGDLPEVVEEEVEGDPVPVGVKLPVTVNGRIFPREDVDVWTFEARRGQAVNCEVHAARLGSPLDARLEVRDPQGRPVAENDDAFGADPFLRFTAQADGTYQVRIHDVSFRGGQAYVYRLTLTTGPHVDWVYPLGGRRGSQVGFEVGTRGAEGGARQTVTLPSDGPPDFLQRFTLGGRLGNAMLLELGDLPEYVEAEPNDQPAQAQTVTVPAVCNGRIGQPGDVDHWAFAARKGERYEFDLRASRLGSPLEAGLVMLDPSGKEVQRTDAAGAPLTDPHLSWAAPADGTYTVRVEERFRSRGGPAYAYRLSVARPANPDFHLHLGADAVTLNRGGEARLKVLVEREGGFTDPIELHVEGLPPGVALAGTSVAANQNGADLSFRETPAAFLGGSHLKVHGTARIGGRSITRTATLPADRGVPELDTLLLAVTRAAPFKIVGEHDFRWAPRGTVFRRHYHIDRGGYDGPLRVMLADRQARHLQGVTGPTITVRAGVREFDYAVRLPAWMETGRTSRSVVMAVGTIKDADGRDYEVGYSSVQSNEQLIAVIEPGRLAIEAERGSVTAAAGQTVSVPVRITRGKALQGPVKLELIAAPHVRGVAAEPVVVADGQGTGALPIRFSGEPGPFNLPVVIRATVMDKGGPVIAETKVDVRPGQK